MPLGLALALCCINGVDPWRMLKEAERHYLIGEQELLAVVFALREWRCYLDADEFAVVTDHHPNTYLKSLPIPSHRQVRWSQELARYKFHWEYRPGRTNVAHPISRQPCFNGLVCCTAATASETSSEIDDSVTEIREGYNTDPWFADPDKIGTVVTA